MLRSQIEQLVKWGRDHAMELLARLTARRLPLPTWVAHKRAILVGASVAKAWRLHLVFPGVSTLAHYQFDKSSPVRSAIAGKPDAIIIKECAAYFPSSQADRELVRAWIDQIRSAGIRPILATVVPVTRRHAAEVPGRVEAIWAFNDWARELAEGEQIPLLDLERAVRGSADDRYLAEELAEADGLHLRLSTYRTRLDRLIPPVLVRAFSD